jgi:hypothetical protein
MSFITILNGSAGVKSHPHYILSLMAGPAATTAVGSSRSVSPRDSRLAAHFETLAKNISPEI